MSQINVNTINSAGDPSISISVPFRYSSSVATGGSSSAIGASVTATGSGSHAEGWQTLASGNFGSHAEGYQTSATTQSSHTEGSQTLASGNNAHAEGEQTIASGTASHAEGEDSVASGVQSHAEGKATIASGSYSHSQGYQTTAGGDYSHASGSATIASNTSSFIHCNSGTVDALAGAVLGGTSNILTNTATNSAIIGGNNITGSTSNTVYVPELEVTSVGFGIILQSSNGTRYRVTVSNGGALTVTAA